MRTFRHRDSLVQLSNPDLIMTILGNGDHAVLTVRLVPFLELQLVCRYVRRNDLISALSGYVPDGLADLSWQLLWDPLLTIVNASVASISFANRAKSWRST